MMHISLKNYFILTVYLNTLCYSFLYAMSSLKLIFSREILIDIDFSHPPFLCAECKFRTVGLVKNCRNGKDKKPTMFTKPLPCFRIPGFKIYIQMKLNSTQLISIITG